VQMSGTSDATRGSYFLSAFLNLLVFRCFLLCSIINDFDYTKTFGGKFDIISVEESKTKSTANPSSSLLDQQSMSDEDSFEKAFAPQEERIVIMAPPGKLGVVIDTFDNGAPGVNAIRDDSVLKDQLQVGDVLVEFDGVDTTEMTALQVSTLIGERSKNPVRKLAFVRNRT